MSTKILEILVLEIVGDISDAWTNKITIDLSIVEGCWWPISFRNNCDIVLKQMETEMEETRYLSYDLKKNATTKFVEDSSGLWTGNAYGGRCDSDEEAYFSRGYQPTYFNFLIITKP